MAAGVGQVDNDIRVEWLILADAAQVVGNKLYVLGGGWDVLTVNSGFPVRQACAVAASFTIPWTATNQPHGVEIELADEDGKALLDGEGKPLLKVNGQVEVGRPPGIPPGQAQRAQIAVNVMLTFEHEGTYVIVARVNGEESGRALFRVVPGPVLALTRRQGDGAA
jgi:hypothetical protein